MATDTDRLLIDVAAGIDASGLGPEHVEALAGAGVELRVDWHESVEGCWRAVAVIEGREGPIAVDPDGESAVARALRGAVACGAGQRGPGRRPVPQWRGPAPPRRRRAR